MYLYLTSIYCILERRKDESLLSETWARKKQSFLFRKFLLLSSEVSQRSLVVVSWTDLHCVCTKLLLMLLQISDACFRSRFQFLASSFHPRFFSEAIP